MSSKVRVVPIGILAVETEKFIKDRKRKGCFKGLLKTDFILFFGYLTKRKGIENLILAFRKCIDLNFELKLVLAGGFLEGDENYVDKLKRKVRNLGLSENVVFTGFVSEEEISWLYANASFCVFPYRRSISSSLPLSMSFGHGKSVIASDIGTLKGEVKEGVTGLFCKSQDSESLFGAIKRLVEDKFLLKKLEVGVVRERNSRSWVKIAKTVINLYQSI